MKIRADRRALATAVKTAMQAQGRTPHHAVLHGVRLNATNDGRLTVTCTDVQTAITVDLAVEVIEPGAAIPPARLVAAFLGGGAETVEIEDDSDDATVTLASGESTLRLRLLATDDWPRLPQPPDEWSELTAEHLDLIGRVAVAASTDPTRPAITGVKFQGERVFATDSYRLAVADVGVDLGDALLPAPLVKAAVAAAGDNGCRYAVGPHTVWFATDTVEMSGQLIANEYPKAENLLRAKSAHHLAFGASALSDALDRIKVLSVDSALVEVIPDGGKVTLRRRTSDGDEATAVVAVDGDFDSRIGFNLTFLQQAVEVAQTDTVRLDIEDHLKPVVIQSGAITQLIVPIRMAVGS